LQGKIGVPGERGLTGYEGEKVSWIATLLDCSVYTIGKFEKS